MSEQTAAPFFITAYIRCAACQLELHPVQVRGRPQFTEPQLWLDTQVMPKVFAAHVAASPCCRNLDLAVVLPPDDAAAVMTNEIGTASNG